MEAGDIGSEELEALRRKRMRELEQSILEDRQKTDARKQFELQKQAALKIVLTPEARSRLANIKMVKPEFAEQLEGQLIQLAQNGRVKLPLSDSQLKVVLRRLQTARKDIKIRRA